MLYQMWMINHSTTSFQATMQQSEAERETNMKALIAAHKGSGARPLLRCESSWADEQHPYWGVTSYPDLEARIKQHKMMNQFGFLRSYEPSFTLLGTADREPNLQSIQPGWIYNLWMVYNDPAGNAAWNALSKEERESLYNKIHSTMDRLGGCYIILCNAFWANDAYLAFGVETFPSLEAFQAFKAELEKINWPSYFHGTSILGTLDLGPEQVKQMLG